CAFKPITSNQQPATSETFFMEQNLKIKTKRIKFTVMENDVKEAVPKYNPITPAQYLKMERASEYKNEYYDGYVQAMSGASLKHNSIASSIAAKVDHFLNGKNCRMLISDMRVCTTCSDIYLYPDALIVCGKSEIEDGNCHSLKG